MSRLEKYASRQALAAAMGALLLTGGCALMPSERPMPGVLPETWVDAPQTADANGVDSLINWWTGFNDETLNDLVTEGLADGPTIEIAALRVRQARSLSYSTLTRFLPEVNAIGSGNYSRAVEGPLLPSATGGTQDEQGTASYGAQVSWEIPLLSRVSASAVGARASNRSALADQRAAHVALVADIARAYVDLRAAQNSYRALEESVEASERLAGILEISASAGFASGADAADARRQAEASRARLPSYQVEIRRAENVLAVLRGHAPGTEGEALRAALSAQSGVPSIALARAPAAPADLLRLRPDVARAEQQALLAAANLGLARSDLLPRLNLTGSINVTDNVLGNQLSLGTTRVSAQPLISIPLFDWGTRIATINQRNAQFDEALVQYRQTVNSAVAEASNSLSALSNGAQQLASTRRAEQAALRALTGRRAAYDAGLLSLVDMLRAEQQAIDARLTRIDTEAANARAAITVYRAFGGGPPDLRGRDNLRGR